MQSGVSLLTWIWLASAAPAAGANASPELGSPRSVLIVDLQVSGDAPELSRVAAAAQAALAEAIAAQSGLRVVSSADLTRLALLAKDRDLVSCSADQQCLAAIAAAGAAELVVSGSVGAIGKQLLLSLTLIDAARAAPLQRVSETAASAEALVALLPGAAARLFGPVTGAATDAAAPRYQLPEAARSFAVFDLGPSGVTDEVARNLTQILSTEIKKVEGTTVIGRADIAAMLQLERQKDVLGCADDLACMAEIGGALGVDRLVAGQVGLLDTTYIISLQLIDPRQARVDNRVSESFRGEPEQLIRAVRQAARRLLGLTVEQVGTLAVSANQPQALVFVDEVERGALPLPPVADLSPGRHALRLTADGFFDWQSDVYVDPGETSAVWASLTERPLAWWQQWWVWTIAGAVVLGAGSLTIWAATTTPRGAGVVTAEGF